MCFNQNVSLLTYTIGTIGSYNLYKMGYIPEAIFYAWVIQMQLIEYFLWKYQPCNQDVIIDKNNITISKIGILVNHLEPIVLWVAILLYSKQKLPQEINYYMIFFIIVTIYYTKNVYNSAARVRRLLDL